MEPTSVEAICNQIIKGRLMSADEVRAMLQRWHAEAKGSTEDLGRFCKWLVAKQYVTEHQANLLLRGKSERFYIHQYKILERIGKGRMAGVYKAVHQLGQVVALKILPPSKAKDPELLGRFQREARIALRLKHPNVVRTFQAGEDDGLHFIVMEYLDGETLEDVLLRRGMLPPAEAVRLVHQALLGLEHLHEQNIIHRDLKPGNLMLVPGHERGKPDNTLHATVKLMDVGLGRTLFDEAVEGHNPDLTGSGVVLGSPDYMAPEQAREARAADIRSDIYSLGCTLYHALAGQPPFPDSNLVRKMVKHATESPTPVRQFNRDVPDGLQQILDWMMAKDPAQRYPTPERAAQALQVFLAAGAEPSRSPEADPNMRPYLKWLEDSSAGGIELLPAAPATVAAVPTMPVPRAASLAAGPTMKAAAVAPIDVELVPVAPPTPKPVSVEAKAGFDLGRRDVVMLVAGAAGVLLAEGIGLLIAKIFQRRQAAPDEEPPTEP
jgi:serine/threonine protein kinase